MRNLLAVIVSAPRRFVVRWQNWLVGFALIAAALIGIRMWPHPPLRDRMPSSTAIYDDHGRLLRLTLARDDQYRLWTPLRDISPQLIEGVKLHEDRWYAWHPGFNPWGLVRGAWMTYVRHRRPQGGSTITMQLARLLWQLDTKTPSGKFKQLARAEQLELYYSKSDILEAYLNFAPYGRNVQGVGAASLVYFAKPVGSLTLPESLTLAVIPQDPARRLQAGHETGAALINPALAHVRNELYTQWLQRHPADASLKPLFALPLNLRPLSRLPFEAPHAVDQVIAAQSVSGAGSTPRIVTTIDLNMQHVLETQIANYVQRGSPRGIHNAAAILVDTRDMGIKAMVGSANYFDASIQGQVNGTLAKRSPGSTLKPFIYALGFDQGVLHPQTVLRDVPTSFGPYTPENFDGQFLGPVTATQALIRSRNIPAVWVASQLGKPDLYTLLRDAGISRMASEQHYGLALVLGGGEVTPQELASLYAMLANQGVMQPLRLRSDDRQVRGTRMLSEEASFMVMDILRQNQRPDETTGAQPSSLHVRWKTGTSWAFRDAWTAGSFGPYVLVVWIGNFDNTGNPSFVGIDAAAPLFFQIIDAIQADHPHLQEPVQAIPEHLKRVEICLASGELPNEWCPQKGWTWFIPGKSPIKVSNIHRPVVVDNITGKAACPPYAAGRTHVEIYEFWPSDLQQVFAKAGMPRRAPPQNADCEDAGQLVGDPPRITSPLRGSAYAMRLNRQEQQSIPFIATADADTHVLFWFVNDAFIGRSVPGESLFWQPSSAGHYDVRVVDDHGRGDTRQVDLSLVE